MEGAIPSIDYLVLGTVTQDVTPQGLQPGGTVTFAALTAQALGLRTALVTSTAGGVLPDVLAGLPAVSLPSAHNTTFENMYDGPRRTQYVRALSGRIALADVPLPWRSAGVVHLGPLVRELEVDMAGQFPAAFVGLTAQGWLRHWDSDGRVSPSPWPEAEHALRAASAVVISREDIADDQALVTAWAVWANVLVVTAGAEGATAYNRGRTRHVPAPRVREVDPTGAGDIFAAVYFSVLRATGDPFASLEPAVTLASASVARAGLESIPTPAEAQAALRGLRLK